MRKHPITKVFTLALTLMLVVTTVLAVPQTALAAAKPTKITLSAKKKTMSVGEKYTLKVKSVTPKNASKSVKFKTSNKKVATVSSKGQIVAKKKGTATITVTSKSNSKAKATCKITVKDVIKKITVSNSVSNTVAVRIGKTLTLKTKLEPSGAGSKKLTFKSNKKSVATVDKKGKIKAKKAGTAKITIKAVEGKAKATITVKVPAKNKVVKSVAVSPASKTVNVGEKFKVTAAVSPKNAAVKLVSYKSSNTKVAEVDSKGNVTAKAAGTAAITVTTLDGNKKASCAVTVKAPAPAPAPNPTPNPTPDPKPDPTPDPKPQEIPITGVTMPASMTIYANETGKVTAAVAPANTTMPKAVTYTSSNPSYLTVGADGTIKPQAAGLLKAETDSVTVNVTAETSNKKTAATAVTIILRENADASEGEFYKYELKGGAEEYEVTRNGNPAIVTKANIAETMANLTGYKWNNDTLKDNWDEESFVNLMAMLAFPGSYKEGISGTVSGGVMTITRTAGGVTKTATLTLAYDDETSTSDLTVQYEDKPTVHFTDIAVADQADEGIYEITAKVQVDDGKSGRNLVIKIDKNGAFARAYRVAATGEIFIAGIEGTVENGFTIQAKSDYVEELGMEEFMAATVIKNSYIPAQ